MYFRCLSLVCLLTVTSSLFAAERTLRVCSDPNNLPFSDEHQAGFENKIAALIASDMQARLDYTWWSQRKSFASKSLDQDACELIIGVTIGLPGVLTTDPYYRSTYVFASRKDRNLRISSLLDERLTDLRIGVHVVGDDYAPPAVALAHRGITKNIVGYSLFGPYMETNPPRRLLDAVESGEIDVAIVWGPFAGYFAQLEPGALDIEPVSPAAFAGVPFTYQIAAAVRRGNEGLKREVDAILHSRAEQIQKLLDQYGVPRVP